jgi:hypothetical protein
VLTGVKLHSGTVLRLDRHTPDRFK